MNTDMKFAVLIDGDNIAPKYLKAILDEVSDMGVATYKRIYSDWSSKIRAGWKQLILEHAVTQVQQCSYTSGKNATDSVMIIDAMDILYTGNVDGFCLVTSDSDFTRLATRLREAGKYVVGMGEAKTPQAFRSACNTFKLLEVISGEDTADEKNPVKGERNKLKIVDIKEIKKSVYKMIDENTNRGKDTYIGEIGSKLSNKYPDFDVRNYGCTKLSTFLEDKMEGIEFIKRNSAVFVTIKKERITKDEVLDEIVKMLRAHGGEISNMAVINEGLKRWNKDFSAKKYGYSKFAAFLQTFSVLEINGNAVRLIEQ